ncbi:gamma-glutamyltranspeptidase [Diplodia corticola]|uniref:Glutathione hydrolase n=1 Tax=Diplodia corticola TaxID=236234 RepID=A0A1J9QZG9_9PEZI|nr:gamma-glutamyltranspeptidase [Diplodia corticola]OJD33792.1 gamma-glutamyltranspeptidase [Diplodia corticola]
MIVKTIILALAAALAPSSWASPLETDGTRGAVASESSECTKIGIDLLAQNGSAADALVGTVLCVGVVAMYHTGIGGGGFSIVRSPKGYYEFVNFRETAPAAAVQNMYDHNANLSVWGGLSPAIPGELRGLEYLHKRWGKLNWTDVVMPSANLARDGFRVSEDLVQRMDSVENNSFLVDDPSWAKDFAPNGQRVKLNDTMTRKRYADTLEKIAVQGPGAFYNGTIANTTIAAIQQDGGIMTLRDLENYTAITQEPLSTTYRGYRLTTGRAPSSGAVGLSVLKILEGYDDIGDPEQVNLTTHRLDEAFRFAYAQRTAIGDPSFVIGMDGYQDRMLTDAVTGEIRSKILDQPQDIQYYDPALIASLETPGTSHFVAADSSGLVLSTTSTINQIFGSRLMVPETGIILNDQMNDFSIPNTTNAFGYRPNVANFILPGKRPLSSTTPIIIEYPDGGGVFGAVGAAGGSRIITATVQNVILMLDHGLEPREALARPRMHDQLQPNKTRFEWAYDNRTVAFMKERGYDVEWMAPNQSWVQAFKLLKNGTYLAAGEPRQKNSAGLVL